MKYPIAEIRNLVWNWKCLTCRRGGKPSRVHGPRLDNMITHAVNHQHKKKCGGAIALECENGRTVMAEDAVAELKAYSAVYDYLDLWLEQYKANVKE